MEESQSGKIAPQTIVELQQELGVGQEEKAD
jgi:hypothetical protein